MSQVQKYQVNDYVFKKQSNQIFQVVKVFNIAGKTFKYRLLNLKRLSESAHRESEIERVATSNELVANKRLPKEKSPVLEKIVLTKIGPYQEHFALIYVDPNSTYSPGGGRITIVLDFFAGSAFFSHVGQGTFKEFIAQCDEYYLFRKLFPKISETSPAQSGEEFFEWVGRCRLSQLKEARQSGEVSKKALRDAYQIISDLNFSDAGHLYDLLSKVTLEVLNKILGEDWWWDSPPSKPNSDYTYLLGMLKDVIAEFKKLNEVQS
ncbi:MULTISPECIES: hypothetical protein [unclassified Acinetobacter]|uniref:hypothetical protein n=1 Tax=unclassified Acinetobacter TaxID=196816 RepID=UPI002447CA23|nr:MULTISPECIES: hypothetical protein [unclassified Acinetobacter]MDH0032540.1 hypothetical protein [Acinetobacter sp. GD04021]MDH0885231.1 hypothetical protein [Acinetobacter sp. GD03873]MDH1084441.1 hypothetical protein [Acinetobacter sp. GD03983]MDH2188329.1 hypothetical protein [Acinetobacter sp. GD03645]MDH2203840.1 hypothetical protein [Acinetobacter sp. GD03647]